MSKGVIGYASFSCDVPTLALALMSSAVLSCFVYFSNSAVSMDMFCEGMEITQN